MKASYKLILIILLVPFLYFNLKAENLVLNEADSLVKLKKYNSAFNLLNSQTDTNRNPEIVCKKIDIALNYFVNSMMHQLFSFKDIAIDESIDDYRGSAGQFQMYHFQIDSVLLSLIQNNPENGKLYKYLGDFYYDVQTRYNNQWLKTYDELTDLSLKNYEKANSLGTMDYQSLHNLGVLKLRTNDHKGSIPIFEVSLKLNPDYASSQYNLAYAHYLDRNFESCKLYSLKALNNYQDPPLKSDAARLIGLCWEELGNIEKALEYYLKANKILPNNYYNLLNIMIMYLKLDKIDLAENISYVFFALEPTNPTLPKDILNYFYEHDKHDALFKIFKKLSLDYKDDNETLGNISFHLAMFYIWNKDKDSSINEYKKAEKYFRKCFKDDHNVFKVIKEQIKQIKELD